jgi:hypothetical protein
VAVSREALIAKGGAARNLANRLPQVLTSLPVLGLLVALCTWPTFNLYPEPGLDPAWGAGLHMAFRSGLVFGKDIVFTYGPFGFLSVPTLWFQDTGLVAFGYSALLHILACTLILWAASRFFDRVVAVAVAIVACSFLGPPLVVIALIASATVAGGWAGERAERLFPFLIAALAAFGFLIKVNFGVEILLIGVLALLAWGWPRLLRRLGEFAVSFVAALVLLWLLAGQPLDALPDYISLSNSVITGHSQTMALADPGSHFQVFLALFLIVGFAVTTWMVNSDLEPRRRLALTAVIALFGFFSFKEGFVRQDGGHIALFTSAMVSAWFALGWRRGMRWPGVVSLVIVLSIATFFQPTSINPIQRVEVAHEQFATVLRSARRHAVIEEGSGSILGNAAIDAAILAKLRHGTVQVSPFEASIAWALGVDWKPLPVFQEYLAYTPALDKENADAIRSATGPTFILRKYEEGAIDNRYPAYNGPEANLETLCNYRVDLVRGAWMLLRKAADRCGAERSLGEVSGHYNERIEVPKGPPGSILLASIHGVGVEGLEQVRATLFRARPRYIKLIKEHGPPGTFRLVPGTAPDGLIMRAPAGADYPQPFTFAPNADSFVVGGPGLSGPIEVEFRAVPIKSHTVRAVGGKTTGGD